jgi:uncharacterized protein (TIGR03067 family)
MTRLIALTVFLTAATSFTTRADDKKPSELEGTWKLKSMVKEGKPEEKGVGMIEFTFSGGNLTMNIPNGGDPVKFTTDPKAKPATLDMTVGRKEVKTRVVKGIYKIEKDTLTICGALDDGERPKEFKATKDNVLMVLERVKK